MSAANYLVRWMPDIVEATANDISRFGPNAAQVRGLLNFLPTMSREAAELSDSIWGASKNNAYNETLWEAMRSANREVERGAALGAAGDVGRNVDLSWFPVRDVATGEVVSDLITPEQYRILTNPLNVGRTFQERMGLMLPDQQGPFMRMVNQLSPASPEEVIAVERLMDNPNVGALLEMLTSPQMAPGQPLARRIKAAETMYRAGREGRRGMA